MTTTMYAFPLRYIGTKTFFASTRDFCKTEEPYYPEGYDEGGPAAWTASGNTLITARNVIHGTTLGTDYRRFTVTRTSMTASGTTTTVPDRYTTFMTWSPEGGRLHTTEVTLPDWTPCLRRMRSASTPTSLFGSGVDCYPGAPAASPNMLLARLAPLARRAITRSSPWHDAQAARAELSKRRARAR